MRETLRITEKTTQQINIPIVRKDTTGAQVIGNLADYATKKGQQIQQGTMTNYQMNVRNQMKQRVSELERNFGNDPAVLQGELNNYRKDLLSSIPQESVRQRIEGEYGVLIQPSINRATEKKLTILDEETELNARLSLMEQTDNLLLNVDDLISNDPVRATQAAQSVQLSMATIQSTINTTKHDGTSIFSPAERATKVLATRDTMFKAAAARWMQNQPNKMKALQDWQANGLVVNFPDENGDVQKVNLRDAMGPQVATKVNDDLVRQLKDEFSIKANIAAAEERSLRLTTRATMRELLPKAQTGQLTLQDVEANKYRLDVREYEDLRRAAIQGNPITDNRIKHDLLQRAYDGEVVEDIAGAMYRSGSLAIQDYQDLVRVQESQASTQADPIQAGRKNVVDSLGGLSQGLQSFQSTVIANATRDYDERVEEFVQINQRQPNLSEAFAIRDEILPAWQNVEEKHLFAVTPKPKFLDVNKSNYSTITPEAMEKGKVDTIRFFQEKHNGNEEAIVNDPDFLREQERLEAFERIIKARQE